MHNRHYHGLHAKLAAIKTARNIATAKPWNNDRRKPEAMAVWAIFGGPVRHYVARSADSGAPTADSHLCLTIYTDGREVAE